MIGTSTLGHQWRLLCSWALMLLWAHTLFSIGNWTREKTSCYLNNPLGQSLESFPSSFAAARSSSSRRRRTAAAASRWNSNRKRGPASYLRYISTSLYIENRVSMDFVMYASPLTLPIYARTNANAYSPTARARCCCCHFSAMANPIKLCCCLCKTFVLTPLCMPPLLS